jgi:asparagine synthase (glutamine-hydrolysing)
MSGICGWFAPSPTGSPSNLIETMARTLETPLTGQIVQRSAANHALAVITPQIERGSLYQDDALWVACEGAPYFNDPGLMKIAADLGPAAALADSYHRKGRHCLQDINGAFSVVIYDLNTQLVLLAVDRIGIRPLCLIPIQQGVVFGATTDSVICHPAVSSHLDPQAIYDYLYFHMIPSPRTIYTGVEKLMPGEYALLENGRLHKDFYWRMEYCDTAGAPQQQLAEEFRGLLRKSVHRALSHPATKIGNFLSGGTDSSTLAGIVTEVTGAPAETYSIGFEAEGFDESQYANIAVKHFGTRHHNYYVTPQDVVDAIPLIARAYDEPFGNASAVPSYYCAKMAREDGVSLMIAGDGGDELFAGNVRYVKQRTFELYYRFPALLRHALIEPLAMGIPGAKYVPPLRKLQSYIAQAKVPLPDRLESYNFLHRSPARDIFQDSFLEMIDLNEPLENMREVYHRAHTDSTLHQMLHLDLKNTLADNDLRKVNRMCEMAGTAVSYPLLDDAMAEFSGRVPANLKIKGSALRYFFKDSLKDFLPAEILKKSKHGFGLPFGLWLNQHTPLRELVGDSLQSLCRRQYINPHYIDSLLNDRHREHASYYGVMIWVLVMLEQWLQSRENNI